MVLTKEMCKCFYWQ